MDAKEKYEHWLEYAQYDLDSANAMLIGGRWLYVVFMCQQAVEKLSKGLYTLYIDDDVPRVHNISKIVACFSDKLPEAVTEDHYSLFDRLTSFYIKNRYPAFKQKMGEMLDENEAKALLSHTKEVFAWLQAMRP